MRRCEIPGLGFEIRAMGKHGRIYNFRENYVFHVVITGRFLGYLCYLLSRLHVALRLNMGILGFHGPVGENQCFLYVGV